MEIKLPGHENQRVEMVDCISEMESTIEIDNVNGAEEAKDVMEEEKNIQFTKKVGEEIKQ